MVNDPNVYGYVNGQPVYSAEEVQIYENTA